MTVIVGSVVVMILGLGACGGTDQMPEPSAKAVVCDQADAARPDRNVPTPDGHFPLPQRTCTIPQDGCATMRLATGRRVTVPPAPGISVISSTATSVDFIYDVGSALQDCKPVRLQVGLDLSRDGLPAWHKDFRISSPKGRLHYALPKAVNGAPLYDGPVDLLFASSLTDRTISAASRVGLSPTGGD